MKDAINRSVAFLFALVICSIHSLTAQPRVIVPAPELTDPAITWGGETNGMKAGVLVGSESPFNVWVFLKLPGEANTASHDPGSSRELRSRIRGTYFKATNGFSGPITVIDEDGKLLPLKQPGVNDSNAYPAILDLEAVRHAFQSRYSIYSGPGFPPISVHSGALPSFHLTNYVSVEESGEYRLTVSPKIYRRSTTNSGFAERVDLLPVTVTFTNQPPQSR